MKSLYVTKIILPFKKKFFLNQSFKLIIGKTFRNKKIIYKILYIPIIMISFFFLMFFISSNNSKKIQLRIENIERTDQIYKNSVKLALIQQFFLIEKDKKYLKEAEQKTQNLLNEIDLFLNEVNNSKDTEVLLITKKLLNQFLQNLFYVGDLEKSGNLTDLGLKASNKKLKNNLNSIDNAINNFKEQQLKKLNSTENFNRKIIYFTVFICVIFGMLISLFITFSIVNPLKSLHKQMRQLL